MLIFGQHAAELGRHRWHEAGNFRKKNDCLLAKCSPGNPILPLPKNYSVVISYYLNFS